MLFDVNQTKFPTPRHRAIWNEGRQVVPLAISIADLTDPEMREGCTQIYNWTRAYFEKMYEDPAQFSGETCYGMLELLNMASKKTTIRDGGLVISSRQYKRMVKAYPEHMSDFGLVWLEITGDEEKVLTNKKYPLFCKYFKLFNDAAYKKPISCYMYILFLDFRVLAPKYKSTIADLLRTLPDSISAYATEMHEYALAKGAVLEDQKYYGQYRYVYKNRYVLVMQIQKFERETPIDIAVSYETRSQEAEAGWEQYMEDGKRRILQCIESLKEVIKRQPDRDELEAYVKKEMATCENATSCKCVAREAVTDVFGVDKYVNTCMRAISKWSGTKDSEAYTDYDIKMLKRLMDVRLSQIDGLEACDDGKPAPKRYFPPGDLLYKNR